MRRLKIITRSLLILLSRDVLLLRNCPNCLLTKGMYGDKHKTILSAIELNKQLPRTLISGSIAVVPVVNSIAYSSGKPLRRIWIAFGSKMSR